MFDRLLRGTGFAYRYTNADTVRVFRSGGALGDASIGQEIIVTGTRIGRNGEKTTAPVVALDKQDLEDAGAQDLSERSEEHTSELQSLMRNSYAVFCLKKKNKTNSIRQQFTHAH